MTTDVVDCCSPLGVQAQAEGASISAKGNTLRIMRVVSDTELELRTGSDANAKQVIDSKYKIVPKLSHEKAFASVISTFARGNHGLRVSVCAAGATAATATAACT